MKGLKLLLLGFLFSAGLTSPVEAATAGKYRCTAVVGPFADIGDTSGTRVVFFVQHYNPTGSVQSIRRVQAWDDFGDLIFDTGSIPAGVVVVPPRAAITAFSLDSLLLAGVQVLVSWSQGVDGPAPIARTDFILFDSGDGVRSAGRTACP
jgi:hypothetical protein